MSAQAPSNTLHVRHILNLLKKKWALWVIPTMLFTAAAAINVLVVAPTAPVSCNHSPRKREATTNTLIAAASPERAEAFKPRLFA